MVAKHQNSIYSGKQTSKFKFDFILIRFIHRRLCFSNLHDITIGFLERLVVFLDFSFVNRTKYAALVGSVFSYLCTFVTYYRFTRITEKVHRIV